jgi:DNA repair protein RecO (recombination protein O)
MPDLSICGICGAELTEDSFVDVMNGRVVCRKCRAQLTNDPEYAALDPSAKIYIKISPSVLAAMRYIAYAPVKRYLSFTLEEDELAGFGVVCERYLLNHLEHGFASLDYYKKLVNDIPG